MPIKQPAVVAFTIHYLKIPMDTTDTFQIEYKRGNSSGMTEQQVISNKSEESQEFFEVIFEKRFQCPVTLQKNSESDPEYRKKKIAFTVYRYRNKTRKVFGRFQIDASKYLNGRNETIEVESPHSKKSYAVITINLNLVKNKDGVTDDNDLNSMSEAMQLTTDHIEEWDVSEALTPEKREEIQNFFQRREKEKTQQRIALSDYMLSPSKKRSHQHPRHVSSPILAADNTEFSGQMDLETFFKPKSTERIQKIKRSIAETTSSNASADEFENTESSTERFNLEHAESDDQFYDKSDKSEKKRKKKKVKKKEESEVIESPIQKTKKKKVDEAQNHDEEIMKIRIFLKSVLTKYWDDSPIDRSKMPKTAAVLTAALLHSKIFENDFFSLPEFQAIINEYNDNYIEGTCINQATNVEKWIVSLYYIASALEMKEKYITDETFSQQRFEMFIHALNGICEIQLDDIAISHLNDFYKPIAVKIIRGEIDGTKACSLLKNQIEQTSQLMGNAPTQVTEFFISYIIRLLDILLVQTILDNPDRCTFQSAGEWNSTITILSEDPRFANLPKFRQAAQLFLMPSMLCDDPSYQSEMCPDLTPAICCRLLKSQKVDDFWPIKNDTSNFEKHYHITEADLEANLSFEFNGSFFDLAKTLKCEDWKTFSFDEDTKMLFPFLEDYF